MADFNQPLPTQQPDLGTLFQYIPAIAAGQVGTQQRQADQNIQSLQDAFAAQQAHNAQTRPLDLQQLTANIGNTNAMTGLHNASARSTNLASDITEATKQGTIGAANAANKTKVGAADLEQMDQMGETFGKIAAATATAPPMMRAQIAKRMLAPFIPEHPELENLLVTHADQLPQYFKDMSDNFYNTTSKAKAAAALAASNLAQSEARTQGLENVANIRAQGQIEAKKAGTKIPASEAQLVGKMSFDKQVGYYNARAKEEEDAGNTDKAQFYKDEADKAYKAWQTGKVLQGQQAQAGKVDVGAATGMQTQPAPQVQSFNNNTQAVVIPKGFTRAPKKGEVAVKNAAGKPGFIPEDQLTDALNNGYTKVQ